MYTKQNKWLSKCIVRTVYSQIVVVNEESNVQAVFCSKSVSSIENKPLSSVK